MHLRTVLLVVSATLGLGGCAVVGSAPADHSVQGIAYALPKGQVLLTASRRPVSPPASSPGSPQVSPSGAAATYQEQAAFTVEPVAPDPNARYVASLHHNLLRNDHLDLTVANGLLSTASVIGADQTGAVVLNAADVAATVASGGLAASQARPLPPGETCAYSLAEPFDPVDQADVDRVNQDLRRRRAGFQVAVYGSDLSKAPRPVDERGAGDALVYRIATSVVIAAVPSDAAQAADAVCPLQAPLAAQAIQAVVPDSRTAFMVKQDASAFTTTKLGLGFSNGMLTSYSADRPSEVAAMAQLAPQVLNALMTVPTQVVQARLNFDAARTALVNQQTQLEQARAQRAAAIVNARAAVVSAQTALLQAEIGQPPAAAAGKVDRQAAIAQVKQQLAEANQALLAALAAGEAAAGRTPQP